MRRLSLIGPSVGPPTSRQHSARARHWADADLPHSQRSRPGQASCHGASAARLAHARVLPAAVLWWSLGSGRPTVRSEPSASLSRRRAVLSRGAIGRTRDASARSAFHASWCSSVETSGRAAATESRRPGRASLVADATHLLRLRPTAGRNPASAVGCTAARCNRPGWARQLHPSSLSRVLVYALRRLHRQPIAPSVVLAVLHQTISRSGRHGAARRRSRSTPGLLVTE